MKAIIEVGSKGPYSRPRGNNSRRRKKPDPGLPPFLRVGTDAVCRADSRPPGSPQHPAWHGPASVYALAKTAGRNYSNVHADVARLVELGLIERTDDGRVTVPFDAVEIRMALAQAA